MLIEFKYSLGDKVKDAVTGYTGIVICVYRWRTGCNRYTVQAQKLDKGIPLANHTFDENELELIKANAVPTELPAVAAPKAKQAPGGPRPPQAREGR